jgi:hypothetical protein
VQVRELDATDGAAVEEFFGSAGAVDHLVLAASPGAVGASRIIRLAPAVARPRVPRRPVPRRDHGFGPAR